MYLISLLKRISDQTAVKNKCIFCERQGYFATQRSHFIQTDFSQALSSPLCGQAPHRGLRVSLLILHISGTYSMGDTILHCEVDSEK